MDKNISYEKKGYLHQHFRIFHLQDNGSKIKDIPFHYHDFHKIILFLSGEAQYIIEGKNYPLHNRDILFVGAGEIHKPVTFQDKSYERIVIYASPEFLQHCGQGKADLGECFQIAKQTSSVMHMPPGQNHDLLYHMEKLERVDREQGFANELYVEILFIEFMILLNRSLKDKELNVHHTATYDEKIQQLLEYINENLSDDLSVDKLAEQVFLSKFYLMRKFKADTGYSIHQYINSKRMLMAKKMLSTTDLSITDICYQCGFKEYSVFSREFKKQFKITPRQQRAFFARL